VDLESEKTREQAIFLGLCEEGIHGDNGRAFEIDRCVLVPHILARSDCLLDLAYSSPQGFTLLQKSDSTAQQFRVPTRWKARTQLL
jgi:hypothetical protein